MRHPNLSPEDICSKGQAYYEEHLRLQVEKTSRGKILVLDIETGEYEIDSDHLAAARRVRAKHPDATLFAVRIGASAFGTIGAELPVRPS